MTSFYINFRSISTVNVSLDVNNVPVCSICLEDISGGETIRKLKCKHCFHDDCLKNWLKFKYYCPNCRGMIFNMPTVFNRFFKYEWIEDAYEEFEDYDGTIDDTWYCFTLYNNNHIQYLRDYRDVEVDSTDAEHDSDNEDVDDVPEFSHFDTFELYDNSDTTYLNDIDYVLYSTRESDNEPYELISEFEITRYPLEIPPISDDEEEDDDDEDDDDSYSNLYSNQLTANNLSGDNTNDTATLLPRQVKRTKIGNFFHRIIRNCFPCRF